jgi:HD-like signal output (HDOD) protein
MTERFSGAEQRSRIPQTMPPAAPTHRELPEIPVRLGNLPPLNAIANQVLVATAKPNVDFKQLASVMECDPAFAADALLVANSALFGVPSRIQQLKHALAVLGIDRIKALAITVAMRNFMGKTGPLVRQCWQHSVACAIVARIVSPLFGITSDTAYTLGLMHDIGRLGLLKSYTAEYSPVLGEKFDNVDQVLRAERALLRVDHGIAGAWLVNQWSFPSTFAQVCEHHHEAVSEDDPEILQAVKVSCRVAEAIGFSAVRYTQDPSYDDAVELPRLLSAQAFPSAEELHETVELQIKSFG